MPEPLSLEMRLHEVGNLLHAIACLAGAPSEDPQIWRERLARIQSLALSASHLGSTDDSHGPATVEQAFRSAEGIMKVMYPQIDLNVTVASEALKASVPPEALERAILNLCLNSAAAMSGKGLLELSATFSDSTVSICVSDDGVGMAPEQLQRLGEPGPSTTAGSGLGVSIVRSMAESFGGSLEIESQAGHGTRVTLHLPQGRNLTTPASLESFPIGTKVLVVEDDALIRQTVERCLIEHGYEVRSTEHPQEALQILSDEPIDVLLTDVVMEPITGSVLATRSKKLQPDIAVILMSGFSPQESDSDQPFIQKPFSEDTLLGAVARSLKHAAGSSV